MNSRETRPFIEFPFVWLHKLQFFRAEIFVPFKMFIFLPTRPPLHPVASQVALRGFFVIFAPFYLPVHRASYPKSLQ